MRECIAVVVPREVVLIRVRTVVVLPRQLVLVRVRTAVVLPREVVLVRVRTAAVTPRQLVLVRVRTAAAIPRQLVLVRVRTAVVGDLEALAGRRALVMKLQLVVLELVETRRGKVTVRAPVTGTG